MLRVPKKWIQHMKTPKTILKRYSASRSKRNVYPFCQWLAASGHPCIYIYVHSYTSCINQNEYMFRLPLQSPTISLMPISPFTSQIWTIIFSHISKVPIKPNQQSFQSSCIRWWPPRAVQRQRTNGNDGRRDHPKSQLLVQGLSQMFLNLYELLCSQEAMAPK